MKQFKNIIIILVLIIISNLMAYASEEIKVKINGQYVHFDDFYGKPFITSENRVLVPLAIIAEKMQADIKWNDETREVTLTKKNRVIIYKIDSSVVKVDGVEYTMDVAPIVVNSRTYLPIRNFTEWLGADVDWENITNTVIVQMVEQGVNLSHNHYWSSQWMFKNIMNQSWPWWVSKKNTDEWHNDSISIPLNENGYPLEIPYKGYIVHTAMFMHMREDGGLYPEGYYTLYFEGEGEILLSGSTEEKMYTESDVNHKFYVNPSFEGIQLTIMSSNPKNPIKNIQVLLPGFEPNEKNPFNPEFLELIESFPVLRFMKPTYVEEDFEYSWSDRATENYVTQSKMEIGGLSHDLIVDLANRTGKTPWINVPHRASDDFIRSMAQLYKDELDKNINFYLEYSNEPWNPLFPAYEYGILKGEELGLGVGEEANARYNVIRTLEIQEIFEEVFEEESDRIIMVLNFWSAKSEIGEYMIDQLSNMNGNVDAFAIAPYFGVEISNDIGDGLKSYTNEEIFDLMELEIENEIRDQIRTHKIWSNEFSARLVTYEAGSHFTTLFHPWDDELNKQMIEIYRDSKMKDIYLKYLELWEEENKDLMIQFVLIEEPHKYGDFGLKYHLNDEVCPKWRALMEYTPW